MAELEHIRKSDNGNGLALIFVHGLGGHPHETWMHDPKKGTSLWPVWVAEDCQCDAWTLGYDAQLTAWRDQAMPLPDQGSAVLDALAVEPGLKNRPLLLIGHSLGGLVIKTAIVQGRTQGVARHRALVERICGVVFIASPHQGSQLATLASALSLLLRTNPQVGNLRLHDAHLRSLHRQFLAQYAELRFPVRTFAETRGVLIGRRIFGINFGKHELVVDPDAAEPNVPGEVAIRLPEDHFSICKPKDRDAQIHKSLVDFIKSEIQGNNHPNSVDGHAALDKDPLGNLAALIDKTHQTKTLIRLSVEKGWRAFILIGPYSELPEKLVDRLAFHLARDDPRQPRKIMLTMTDLLSRENGHDVLRRRIEQNHGDNRYQKAGTGHIFHVHTHSSEPIPSKMLEEMILGWDSPTEHKGAYLIFVFQTEDRMASQQDDWAAYQEALAKKGLKERILPPLRSPERKDFTDWVHDFLEEKLTLVETLHLINVEIEDIFHQQPALAHSQLLLNLAKLPWLVKKIQPQGCKA